MEEERSHEQPNRNDNLSSRSNKIDDSAQEEFEEQAEEIEELFLFQDFEQVSRLLQQQLDKISFRIGEITASTEAIEGRQHEKCLGSDGDCHCIRLVALYIQLLFELGKEGVILDWVMNFYGNIQSLPLEIALLCVKLLIGTKKEKWGKGFIKMYIDSHYLQRQNSSPSLTISSSSLFALPSSSFLQSSHPFDQPISTSNLQQLYFLLRIYIFDIIFKLEEEEECYDYLMNLRQQLTSIAPEHGSSIAENLTKLINEVEQKIQEKRAKVEKRRSRSSSIERRGSERRLRSNSNSTPAPPADKNRRDDNPESQNRTLIPASNPTRALSPTSMLVSTHTPHHHLLQSLSPKFTSLMARLQQLSPSSMWVTIMFISFLCSLFILLLRPGKKSPLPSFIRTAKNMIVNQSVEFYNMWVSSLVPAQSNLHRLQQQTRRSPY